MTSPIPRRAAKRILGAMRYRAGHALASLAVAFALCTAPAPANAASWEIIPTWPAADVNLTVPFSQGSEADILFSLFSSAFMAETGKRLNLVHVPGQAGAVAWARMVDDSNDGTTLTAVLLPHVFLRAMLPDSGIKMENMVICHITAYTPCVLWTASFGSISSVDNFADTAATMNGRFLVAGPGRYSAGQIAARVLDRAAGVRSTYIPYTGSIDAGKAVLNRQAGVFWAHSVALTALGSSVKPLAIAAQTRLRSMPEVPTFHELGYDVEEGMYYGIAVPADTPEESRQRIADFFSRAARSPAFRAQAEKLGFIPQDVPLGSMPDFAATLREALAKRIEDYDLFTQ